jgi:hypothetical protein
MALSKHRNALQNSQTMTTSTNFAVFILTHGRPTQQFTFKSLRTHGYTGPVYFVVDDADATLPEYRALYGNAVHVFSKTHIAKTFDVADNFYDNRSIVFARNAVYQIAKQLGVRYFAQLDDDYVWFTPKLLRNGAYIAHKKIENLDAIFAVMVQFLQDANLHTVAMSQGGDWIGGLSKQRAKIRKAWYQQGVMLRKAMNSFICDTEKPVPFFGRINEDVNAYVVEGSRGLKAFTLPGIMLVQKQTQTNSGGMTDIYLAQGTYIKSFYTVMMAPSAVKISAMHVANPRLHHKISWKNAVPVYVPEHVKKDNSREKTRNG